MFCRPFISFHTVVRHVKKDRKQTIALKKTIALYKKSVARMQTSVKLLNTCFSRDRNLKSLKDIKVLRELFLKNQEADTNSSILKYRYVKSLVGSS